jgi:hypothetical protein
MVPPAYHTFFGGCASVAGTLIGLLFVAISVSPHKHVGSRAPLPFQIQAGVAFTTLINALVIALAALLPGNNLGTAAAILAGAGISSTPASSQCSATSCGNDSMNRRPSSPTVTTRTSRRYHITPRPRRLLLQRRPASSSRASRSAAAVSELQRSIPMFTPGAKAPPPLAIAVVDM